MKVELIQRQNVELRKENERLRKAVKDRATYIREQDRVLLAFQTEIQSVNRILWAAAHTVGGRLTIPDSVMVLAQEEDSFINAFRRPEDKAMVIEAKTRLKGDKQDDQQEGAGSGHRGNGGDPKKDG